MRHEETKTWSIVQEKQYRLQDDPMLELTDKNFQTDIIL